MTDAIVYMAPTTAPALHISAPAQWGSPKKPILDFPLGHMAKPFTVTYYFHVLKEKCAGAHYLLACHTTHPDKRHK